MKIIGYIANDCLDNGATMRNHLLAWINWNKIDVVVLSALTATSAADPTLVTKDGANNWFPDIVSACRASSPSTKILISIGGTTDLTAIMHNAGLRATLVSNVLAAVTTYSVDGIDMDWEDFDANHQTDLAAFIDAIYPTLHAAGQKISLFSQWSKSQFEVTVAEFAKVDYLMTSSYYGDAAYVEDFINTWAAAGYDKSKIFPGLAMEGFDLSSSYGARAWWDDVVDVYNPDPSLNSIVLSSPYHITTEFWGIETMTAPSYTLIWQGINQVSDIATYAKNNGYGGVGFWSIEKDYMTSVILTSQSILKTAYDNFNPQVLTVASSRLPLSLIGAIG